MDSSVLAFALVAAVVTVTPGADTVLVIRNALRGGWRDGALTTLGICAGLFVHATLSALGVSIVLLHSAAAFHAVKLAGGAYLIWLGLRSLVRAAAGAGGDVALAGAAVPLAVGRSLREGLLSNLLNPKVAVFYLALLPQFIGPGDAVLARSMLLAAIHYLEGVVWLVAVAALVDRARRVMLYPAVRRGLEATCGVVLVGLGARLALAPARN